MAQKKQPMVLHETNMYASYDSIEEVMEFMTKYAGKEKAYLCYMTQGLIMNTLVKIMDEQCDGTAIAKRAKPLFRIKETT